MTETSAPSAAETAPRDDHVVLEGVGMTFGDRVIFDDLNCAFPRGKISVVLGGSGVGKSTILRLIAGLLPAEAGSILVDGTDVVGLSERGLQPVRRKIGMMFQAGALLDSTTVFDNLAFPLREHTSLDERTIATEVYGCLMRMGLTHAAQLLPSELSGGMIKRVALARAIIAKPDILLCDEPFSGLDPITAKRIELLLLQTCHEMKVTTIMVSHSVGATTRIADHLLVMLPDGNAQGSIEDMQNHDDPRVSNLLKFDVDEQFTAVVERLEASVRGGGGGLDSTWS